MVNRLANRKKITPQPIMVCFVIKIFYDIKHARKISLVYIVALSLT